jgi:hypothetical protein
MVNQPRPFEKAAAVHTALNNSFGNGAFWNKISAASVK